MRSQLSSLNRIAEEKEQLNKESNYQELSYELAPIYFQEVVWKTDQLKAGPSFSVRLHWAEVFTSCIQFCLWGYVHEELPREDVQPLGGSRAAEPKLVADCYIPISKIFQEF